VILVDDTVPAGEWGKEGARYALRVTHREHGKVERDFRPGSGELLKIQFLQPATLTVELEGLTGHSLDRKLCVELEPHGTPPLVTLVNAWREAIETDGTKLLGPVQPGRYDVRVSCAGAPSWCWVLSNHTVDLRSGSQQLRLPAPIIHTLTVHCPGGETGTRVRLERIGQAEDVRSRVQATLGVNRKARFVGFPAGRYRIQSPSRDGGSRTMELDLPGPDSVTLE
jgi:hypothetical protein